MQDAGSDLRDITQRIEALRWATGDLDESCYSSPWTSSPRSIAKTKKWAISGTKAKIDERAQAMAASGRDCAECWRERDRARTLQSCPATDALIQQSRPANGATRRPPRRRDAPGHPGRLRGWSAPVPVGGVRHHLYIDVNPATGAIKINVPDLRPWELADTRSLDVAE